jgi:hypothetical protein
MQTSMMWLRQMAQVSTNNLTYTYRSFQENEGTSLTSASGLSHMLFPIDNFNIFAQFSHFLRAHYFVLHSKHVLNLPAATSYDSNTVMPSRFTPQSTRLYQRA